MDKCKKFTLPDDFVLDYDRLYVIPANEGQCGVVYGDSEYIFKCSETEEALKEIVDKVNSIGCTSFRLSKEELLAAIEKLREYGCYDT
jgi:hypothetical protein